MANPVVRGVVRTPVRSSSFRIGTRLPEPITLMPLTSTLELIRGVGPATFTRSTIATFVDKDDGLVKTASIDVARFEKEGLLIEGATTNEALHNRDFTNAVHVKTNITAVKDAIGADGVANAASTLTATAANGTVFQTVTKVSDENTYYIDVRRKTGTGTIEISDDGGTGFTDITASINSTTYTRFEITTTQANPSFGTRIVTSSDEIEVDYEGLEALKGATSRIETSASPVSRTQDVLSIPTSNAPADADLSVSIKACVIDAAGSSEMLWGINNGITRIFMNTSGAILFVYNNTTDTTAGVGFDTEFTAVMAYNKVSEEFSHYVDGVKDANAPVSVTPTASAISNIFIGASQTGTAPLYGHVRDFRIYDVTLTDSQVLAI